MSYDFQLETKLKNESPTLHRIFTDNVVVSQNMLVRYKSHFPDFTDHTALHSLEVIAFCNELVADNISKLNCDEIFVLLMGAYLHDSGMGISKEDYNAFSKDLPPVTDYMSTHPNVDMKSIIRKFHNDFSGKFIEKYSFIFDFPTEKHLFSIIQVSKGHRKTDLFDEKEYPAEIPLENGNVIHLPYLAALIRLADELDIAEDRNIQFMYDTSKLTQERDIIEFAKHKAIKKIEFEPDNLLITVDYTNPGLIDELDDLFDKLENTFQKCINVITYRTPFVVNQKHLKLNKIID